MGLPLPAALIGDESRLKQILVNMCKNALKFTMRGYVKILTTYDSNANLIKVHVADTGKGIRPQ